MRNELKQYLNEIILTKYKGLDPAHNETHIKEVLRYAKKLVKNFPDINEELVETSIYYHDLGNLVERDKHHIISAQIVRNDSNLKDFFNEEEIESIASACENHRCSNPNKKEMSIMEKIVNDADSCDGSELHRWIERSFLYTHTKFKGIKTFEEICEDVYNHTIEKFGKNGYSKSFLLEETNKLVQDDIYFRNRVFNNKDIFMQEIKFLGSRLI